MDDADGRIRHLLLAGLALVVAACAPQPGTDAPLLRLVTRDSTFESPPAIPAGLVRIRLVNHSAVWHEALLVRLEDSATVESYVAATRAGQDFPAGAIDVGGPGTVVGGDSSEVVLSLAPGRYAILCWVDNHVRAGMIVPLTVSGDAPPVRLAAEAEIGMRDFTYALSAPLHAGTQHVRVVNQGTRAHELSLYRLADGRTPGDYYAWHAKRDGAPPALPVGGVASAVPGREVIWTITLPPGRYFMGCEVPEGETPHAQMGMVHEFTID